MGLIDEILGRVEFRDQPPVLVDVGASLALHPKWRAIASHAICVAFEADAREAGSLDRPPRFREYHAFPAVVAERAAPSEAFYLTASPFCSSRLRPDAAALGDYSFAPLFDLTATSTVQTVALPEVLEELGLTRVDWFKTDSQGTDVRLFASLGDDLVSKVLVAEFEPGLIDAYEEEDKLEDLLRYLAGRSFWLSEFTVQGVPRGSAALLAEQLTALERRYLDRSVKKAPAWAEVECFNDFKDEEVFSKRDWLLGCTLALLRRHDAFALELASRAGTLFPDPAFNRVEELALTRIRRGYLKLPFALARELGTRVAR